MNNKNKPEEYQHSKFTKIVLLFSACFFPTIFIGALFMPETPSEKLTKTYDGCVVSKTAFSKTSFEQAQSDCLSDRKVKNARNEYYRGKR